jgi:hypothetical protein
MLQIVDAQINIGGKPHGFDKNLKIKSRHSKGNAIVTTPALDMEKIKEEDKKAAALGREGRVAYPIEVSYDLTNSGEWQELDNGDRIWKLTINSPGAAAMYLYYSEFWLPEGATFYIYDSTMTKHLGGFTSKNNKGTKEDPGMFATADLKTDQLILEYYEPQAVKDQGIIAISTVNQGYLLTAGYGMTWGFGWSTCTINVNCSPEGDNWQNQKRSVVKIVTPMGVCSGSIMRNTNNDGKLYVLTAGHCLEGSAPDSVPVVPALDAVTNPIGSQLLFYWNYESPSCTNPSDSPPTIVTTGATVVANYYDQNEVTLDFALLELMENPLDKGVNIYYNGWDRQVPTGGGVIIGHPWGDIKKIALYSSTPYISSTWNPNIGHYGVNYFETPLSITSHGYSRIQPGSSGSPMYNTTTQRVIGNLWGATNNDIPCAEFSYQVAYVSRLSSSWNLSSSYTSQLAYWLDPKNSNSMYLDGTDCNTIVNSPNYPTNTTPAQPTTVLGCSISATNTTIPNGANVIYHATNSVTLQSSFQVNVGSTFQIK